MEDKERTLYCGNLSEKITEDLLYELFLQAGPLENVVIPKDKDGRKKNFGFITFKHAVSVPYAVALMNGVSLYGRTLRLDPRGEASSYNPYLEQLRNYETSVAQQSYHSNDNRSRRHDSRRYESRIESNANRFDSLNLPSPVNLPVLYPGFNQQHSMPMGFPQTPTHGVSYPPGQNMYPNQWPGYR